MFHVGQKVVCVLKQWNHPLAMLIPQLPKYNGIYHVRMALSCDCGCGTGYIKLTELVNPPVPSLGGEPMFNSEAFRPVIEKKTDISIFTRMTDNTKIKEPA